MIRVLLFTIGVLAAFKYFSDDWVLVVIVICIASVVSIYISSKYHKKGTIHTYPKGPGNSTQVNYSSTRSRPRKQPKIGQPLRRHKFPSGMTPYEYTRIEKPPYGK